MFFSDSELRAELDLQLVWTGPVLLQLVLVITAEGLTLISGDVFGHKDGFLPLGRWGSAEVPG